MKKILRYATKVLAYLAITHFSVLGSAALFSNENSIPDDSSAVVNTAVSNEGREEPQFLQPEQAFKFSYETRGDNLLLHWDIAEGYYLYQQRLSIKADGEKRNLENLPQGEHKQDKYFGDVIVYHTRLDVEVPVQDAQTFELKYQGCADAGLCYPPQKVSIHVGNNAGDSLVNNTVPESTSFESTSFQSADQKFFNSFSEHNAFYSIFLFFIMGVATAFAGCSYPMFPILSRIIIGQGGEISKFKGFTLSLAYVLPIAIVYALIGVIAGLFGSNLSIWFQQPAALFVVSGTLVLMALSMFGFFELQMPSAIQSKLHAVSSKQTGGSYTGAAIMGFISAFVVSACVVPPVVAAITYITQTGDIFLGAAAMFCFGLGLGFPLILLGLSASWLLPKAGKWMDTVQKVMAIFLLSGAIWIIDRVIPDWITVLLWASLAAFVSYYLFKHKKAEYRSALSKNFFTLLPFAFAVLALGLLVNGVKNELSAKPESVFQYIDNQQELAAVFQENQDRIILLDYYADWCTGCQTMEKKIFKDPGIAAQLAQFKTLKVDLSDMSEEKEHLMKQQGIVGPPSFLFFTPQGKELISLRVTGELNREDLSKILARALDQTI